MGNLKEMGRILKDRASGLGLNQGEIADSSSVSPATVSNVFAGDVSSHPFTLTICNTLGLDFEEFVGLLDLDDKYIGLDQRSRAVNAFYYLSGDEPDKAALARGIIDMVKDKLEQEGLIELASELRKVRFEVIVDILNTDFRDC
jgi:transcriptional regulator with XRE-family HTH domain